MYNIYIYIIYMCIYYVCDVCLCVDYKEFVDNVKICEPLVCSYSEHSHIDVIKVKGKQILKIRILLQKMI